MVVYRHMCVPSLDSLDSLDIYICHDQALVHIYSCSLSLLDYILHNS
jgi:hypothetical protein